jgi:hypothetical protein
MKIPDEAIAAGLAAWGQYPVGVSPKRQMANILEAAAPHLYKPRQIRTMEELDALPFETVIRDGDQCVLERWGEPEENGWVSVMVTSFIPPDQITLPAVVLYEPNAGV